MLVVDDEHENAEYLRRLFRNEFDIEVAHAGSEALALLAAQRVDVLITDQMMPGMTGTELLQQTRELHPDTVRILVTGYADLDVAIDAINRGRCHGFFAKPIDRTELRAAVDAALVQIRATRALQARVDELRAENAELRGSRGGAAGGVAPAAVAEEPPVDLVTGLPSRATMRRRLEEEVARSARFGLSCALVLLRIPIAAVADDADAGGNEVVRDVAALVHSSSRRFDVGGRWSHDVLALVLPQCDRRAAVARVARLRGAWSPPPGVGQVVRPQPALASAVAAFPEDGPGAADLIERAEERLE